MEDVSEYALFMKMLEIIETKQKSSVHPISENERERIVTVIGKIEGGLFLNQSANEEVAVQIGDTFQNVSNSVIATRGSIASGIIKIREAEGEEVANAFQQLEKAISEVDLTKMSEQEKQKALELLDELTKQAASPNKVKVVLAAIGQTLWDSIKHVDKIVSATSAAWPIVSKLWS